MTDKPIPEMSFEEAMAALEQVVNQLGPNLLQAWLERLDAHREALRPVFESVYGARQAPMWWQRWRLFLLSVEELFGYDQGQQWWVSHYLFAPRR